MNVSSTIVGSLVILALFCLAPIISAECQENCNFQADATSLLQSTVQLSRHVSLSEATLKTAVARGTVAKKKSMHFWGHTVNFQAAVVHQAPVLDAPSTEPYQLEAGTDAPSYSQFNQDLILLPILSQLGAGFFVESGALDGEFCSNTLLYEMKHGWKGLLVEPDPRFFPKIHSHKHRHAHAFNGCLSPTDRAENLQFDVESIPGWSKISKNGQNASHEVSSISVQAQPLHALLETLGQTVVDFWSLDIEGSEGKVLKGTDFSKVEVGVMLIEMNKNDENNKEIHEVMTKEGFKNIGHTDVDQIFINPKYFQKRGLLEPTSKVLGPKYGN